MDLSPELTMRISDAARRLQVAKSIQGRAKTHDEWKLAQSEVDAAEQNMIDVGMTVNRGLERAIAD